MVEYKVVFLVVLYIGVVLFVVVINILKMLEVFFFIV